LFVWLLTNKQSVQWLILAVSLTESLLFCSNRRHIHQTWLL